MKNSQKDAKVIDYNIVLVMFPMVLLGSLLGVQVNVILPEAVLLISLTVVLVLLSINSVYASIKFRIKENIEIKEKKAVKNLENPIEQENHESSHENTHRNIISLDDRHNEKTKSCALPPINRISSHQEEKPQKKEIDEPEKEEIKESNNVSINNEEKASENKVEEEENKSSPKTHPKLIKIIARERTH